MGKSLTNMHYDLTVKNIEEPFLVRKYADFIVFDIKSITGENSEVEIHVENEVKRKDILSVTIILDSSSEQFVTTKKGKKIYPTLNKAKRAILKSFLRNQKKKKRFERDSIRHFNQWGIA